jgi:hypothetical protein
MIATCLLRDSLPREISTTAMLIILIRGAMTGMTSTHHTTPDHICGTPGSCHKPTVVSYDAGSGRRRDKTTTCAQGTQPRLADTITWIHIRSPARYYYVL